MIKKQDGDGLGQIVYRFCHEQGVELRQFEYHEMASPVMDRDAAVMIWAIRKLATVDSEDVCTIIESIVAYKQEKGYKNLPNTHLPSCGSEQ